VADAYAIFRRPRGCPHAAWERLPGNHGSPDAALAAVRALELTAPTGPEWERAPHGWEYSVQVEGRSPAIWPQLYRHRMMRPQ
jgi:hypothetical protein